MANLEHLVYDMALKPGMVFAEGIRTFTFKQMYPVLQSGKGCKCLGMADALHIAMHLPFW